MRIAYTKPAEGERHLVDRNAARQLVISGDPDLELLVFETRHGPNMTKGLAYCASYSRRDLRILSVEEGLISDAMDETFATVVVPWVLNRIRSFRERGYSWPCVVVALDGAFVHVTCSAGGLFPSLEDVRARAKGRDSFIAAIGAVTG